MFTSLIGLLVIERTCWALLLNGLLPLVTIQRSAQNPSAEALANLSVSPFSIGSTVAALVQLPGFALDGDVLAIAAADRYRVNPNVLFGTRRKEVFPLWPF